jgi:hypothetical protein
MYEVEFRFRVFTFDGHAALFKNETPPFVPFPGLRVYTSARDLEGGTVAEVTWSVPEKRFICRLHDDDWTKDKRGSLKEALRFWQEMNWEVKKEP